MKKDVQAKPGKIKGGRRQGGGGRQWRASWREEIVFHQTLSQERIEHVWGSQRKKKKGMFGWNTKREVKRRENKA